MPDWKLLTEAEVASRLRCSVAKIRKLRAAGRLAFLPGRPVLVLESDFLALEREEQEAAAARQAQCKTRHRSSKPPDPPPTPTAKPGFSAAARGRVTALQLKSFANSKARRQRER